MRLMARTWSDWPAVFSPREWNWIDFRFINLYVEWSRYKDSFDFGFALLGFNVEFTLSWYRAAPRAAKEPSP